MSKKRTNKKWYKNKKGGSNKETSRLTRTNESKKSNHARFSPYISTKFFDIQTPESSISNASPLHEEAVDAIKKKFSDSISKNKITDIESLNMLNAALHDKLSKAYDEKNNKKKYKYKILPTREELQQQDDEDKKLKKEKMERVPKIKKYRKNLLKELSDNKKAEEANKEYQEQLNEIPDKLRKTKKNRDRDTIIGNPTKSRKRFYFFN